ncbi:30S ribosomal protein S5 [Candidatus Nomurabacteria bacterium]|nr:30S ribosomal protein S5 [Candidatus Nomurabacteria bacterium]
MAEEKTTKENIAPAATKQSFEKKPNFRGRRRQDSRQEREKDEFQQKMVDLARVTRVMAGGKRMKFRACMVVGDGKGKVGMAVAKGADVSSAINKAVTKAKKALITVQIVDGTIPHEINIKFKAARLMLKPAKKGNGIKAGGVVRVVLELAGVKDAVAKILGTNNKVNNVKATVQALNSFKTRTKMKTVLKKSETEVKEAKV